jgi:uncharacterized protein DUF2599
MAFTRSAPLLIARAHWTHPRKGYRLIVRPSSFGRQHADAAPARALWQAVRDARPTPLRITNSIHQSLLNQLRCHTEFAPYKPTWDLEAWRPNVGYLKTVEAECNP